MASAASLAQRGWHLDPRDKDPRNEELRQIAVLRQAHMLCPAVDFVAIPNAGKRSLWEAKKRQREGMKRGALDLVATWEPCGPDDRGVAFIEMKDGQELPDVDQRERLDRYVRQGHQCGVFRQEASVMLWLYNLGAPFVFAPEGACL